MNARLNNDRFNPKFFPRVFITRTLYVSAVVNLGLTASIILAIGCILLLATCDAHQSYYYKTLFLTVRIKDLCMTILAVNIMT